MNDREYVEDLYRQLQCVVDADKIADAWGSYYDGELDVSESLLMDFFNLIYEKYFDGNTEVPEWIFMYCQIFSWQFQLFHEGVITYYTNFYGSDTADGIQRMSDCLHRHGYEEMAKWYDYGIFDYESYEDFSYPQEQKIRAAEIDKWMNDYCEMLWHFYLDLLLDHKEELLAASEHWEDTSTETEKTDIGLQSEKQPIQLAEEILSFVFVELSEKGTTNTHGEISCLEASQIDGEMVSRMVMAKELTRIQTTMYFSRKALKLLDEALFSVRHDILFRIYIGQQEKIDLRHFAEMVHVRRLCLNCMKDVDHIEILDQFENLTTLTVDLDERTDYSFVKNLPTGLQELFIYIGENQESVTFGDNHLYEMEWLSRLPRLRKCYIGNINNHIELLVRKDSVRELIVFEMPCPSLEVMRMLNVQSLIVNQQHAWGLERLKQTDSLQEIELVKITDINCSEFLADFPDLKKITLRGLPEDAMKGLVHNPSVTVVRY